MVPRTELFELQEGEGRLQIRGEDSALALFVDGQPLSANWDQCYGSLTDGFYLKDPFLIEASPTRLRHIVADVPPLDRPLSEHFFAFLRWFSAGPYRLDYDEERPGLLFYDLDYMSDQLLSTDVCIFQHNSSANVASAIRSLLPSQCADKLDKDRVLEWAVAIEAGALPTVITATIEWACCEFILDGHHKLSAYRLARRPVRRLAITQMLSNPIKSSDWPGGRLSEAPDTWGRVLAHSERGYVRERGGWSRRPRTK
jgi:hypothetical protein